MFQIKGNTYDEIALAKLGLNDFSPQTQRMTAMFLLRQRHIRERLLVGDIRGAIDEGSREWASLPDPKTNESRYMKSGTDRRQSSVDLTKAIEMYGRLKTIWEKKLAPQASR
jgi:muramidase (phage lysozyme)